MFWASLGLDSELAPRYWQKLERLDVCRGTWQESMAQRDSKVLLQNYGLCSGRLELRVQGRRVPNEEPQGLWTGRREVNCRLAGSWALSSSCEAGSSTQPSTKHVLGKGNSSSACLGPFL